MACRLYVMSIWVVIYRVSAGVCVLLVLIWVGAQIYPKFQLARDLAARQLALEEEIRRDEELFRHLREKQQRLLNDPRFIEKIAREELGLARPGETVFKFVDDPAPLTPRAPTSGRASHP